MWYVSGTGWERRDGRPIHGYHIKYAESDDGLTWNRNGHVCIDYRDESEYAIARPCVIRDGDRYRMWFCARGETYRLGYAESWDGLTWERRDEEAGLDPSSTGWDSEMICYPAVFDSKGRRHLLYNGNGYGASGIGYAIEAGPWNLRSLRRSSRLARMELRFVRSEPPTVERCTTARPGGAQSRRGV